MDIYLSAAAFDGPDGLRRAAAVARQAGCTGLEAPASLLASESATGSPVRVVSITWRPDRGGNLPDSLALAQRVGARAVNIYGMLPAGGDADAARRALVAEARAALDGSPADGPILLLENELAKAPGFSASLSAWTQMLRAVDSPRFRGTLDAANFVAAGEAAALNRHLPNVLPLIAHVHAKGIVPFTDDLHQREPFRRRWRAAGEWLAAPAGEGSPDWGELLAMFAAARYRGAATVEPFQELAMITRAVETVRRATPKDPSMSR